MHLYRDLKSRFPTVYWYPVHDMGYSLVHNNTRSSFIHYPLCFLIDAVPSLCKREDEKDGSDRS